MQKQRPPHFWGGLERFLYFLTLPNHQLDGVTVEVLDRGQAVVLVQANAEGISVWLTCGGVENEWVRNDAVTGLEGNTWLESVRIDCTYHL